MRHLIIGIVIGVLTILVSVFVLSENGDELTIETEPEKTIQIGQVFDGANYSIRPTNFECGDYSAKDETSRFGCVLSLDLTNTTSFEQVLNLDGDKLIAQGGNEFESSHELSQVYIAPNELKREIEKDETVSGGIFFDVEVAEPWDRVEIYESVNTDPILITL